MEPTLEYLPQTLMVRNSYFSTGSQPVTLQIRVVTSDLGQHSEYHGTNLSEPAAFQDL